MACRPADSIDAIVTDPPAGIAFMGKEWDRDHGGRDQWIANMAGIAREALRVAKPGAHALVWSLPRTSHWTATAWEDAGWEVRDRIAHVFGSGFPKSLNIGKAIDKAAGAEREVVGIGTFADGTKQRATARAGLNSDEKGQAVITAPATPAAAQWDGWGTALKPAIEDYWLLRKPLSEPTVAANVLKWGTGGLNIDACRIATAAGDSAAMERCNTPGSGRNQPSKFRRGERAFSRRIGTGPMDTTAGRWPANLIHDGSDEVVGLFPEQAGGGNHHYRRPKPPGRKGSIFGAYENCEAGKSAGMGDSGSAARFFYCAKASRAEREAGLEGMEASNHYSEDTPTPMRDHRAQVKVRNAHPTVKPLALMRYLCRLVTPPGGIVLDPFAGSGTTCIAAIQEGFRTIGIEQDAEYCEIARRRIGAAKGGGAVVQRSPITTSPVPLAALFDPSILETPLSRCIPPLFRV
ncbi:MAG: site-specific DNA-methyltransferase [Acidobacteria bacterium]|nr:site-specific DNA-methyltransferase [Acidobacteriota bacterium]